MCIFNPATESHGLLKANYDKLLHLLGVFTLMIWYTLYLTVLGSAIIVFVMCGAKMVLNFAMGYLIGKKYNPIGDWIFNIAGFGLWMLYEVAK